MKKQWLATLTIWFSVVGFTAEFKSVRELSWLTGDWKSVTPTGEKEIHFSSASGNLMLGTNRELTNGAVTFAELIQLKDDQTQKVFLNPNPIALLDAGASGTVFLLKEMTATKVVFELATHIFPKTITYEINSDQDLKTTVEGTQRGVPVALESTLARQK